MSAQTLTLISGVTLLAVFALAGWRLKRGRARRSEGHPGHEARHDD
jgi:hypothetical protein